MAARWSTLLTAAASLCQTAIAEPVFRETVSFQGPFEVERNGVRNINIEYNGPLDGELSLVYGDCGMRSPFEAHHKIGRTHIGSHPAAKRHLEWTDQRPTKFVWMVPEDVSSGCLHAFVDSQLVGRSSEHSVKSRKMRKRATFAEATDPMGPWFDGVEYLKQKQPDDVFVASVKNKTFGILGAGISGLHTGLLLDSVGIHNWKILESSERVGGRIRTTYLNGSTPDEHQHHELGPMRFPHSIYDAETNETYPINDQKMIYQLADVLNEINADADPALQVKFIPWIQVSDNAPVATKERRPDGTVPGRKEIAADPSLMTNTTYSNATAAKEAIQALDDFKALTPERRKFYATNVFKAHKEAVETGMFDFSEVEYLLHVMSTDLNVTDEVTPSHVVWPMWEFETVYFLANEWRTVDGGISRLPAAFENIIKDRIAYKTKVFSVKYNEDSNNLNVTWRETGGNPWSKNTTTEQFDYVFNSVPFNVLKYWELPPHSSLMRRAIERTVFLGAVKVAMQYKTRFWEHLEHPIIGGCGRTDIYGIGQICYPSYNINGTGPGVMLTSYAPDADAVVACSMPVEEHIAYIQRAMVEIHGPIADEMWTGNYERHCWEQDEHHAGAFAVPIVPQQQLYLPAFWQTEFNTVFIGEHTSFTHSWVFSALESSTRGTVQMLLDLGLVDEAKQITRTWMARWISV
ncbi:L-amino-acid oxidase [Colletotrichum abscissum]|uniref:L-amino-acid oxidase n=1 Tax=Colletotrichum abscissum TaxID=1671311 RepID=A0A9Q0B0I0_9PEZI|nr:L-amino-acid oxidase [Colletotrichum abscissum]KAI3540132.1 L-amino-acid oxidase [Colletotrichum abscissum]KAK1481995.1 L-amino-acid oxidase [Colletotrichum abscissum]